MPLISWSMELYIYRCQAFHIFPPFFHLSFSNLRSSIFFQSFFYGIFFIFAIRQFPFNERRNANEKLFTRGRGRDGLRRLEIFLSFNIDTRLGCVHRAALIAVSLACYSTKKDATDSGIWLLYVICGEGQPTAVANLLLLRRAVSTV